jgi:arylsulfatase A-like enzyme
MPHRLKHRLAQALVMATLVVGCCLSGCKAQVDAGDGAEIQHGAPPASRPNIVLVVVCSCRYANLSISGYHRDTTPFLKSLRDSGVSFENAVSSSSWTKPSVTSILTGLTPNVHRLTDYYDHTVIQSPGFEPKRVLADEIVTLGECLADAGYATFYRGNNIHAGHFFNIAQGFPKGAPEYRRYGAARMLRDFRAWLGELDNARPFFFYMLTADPHLPYEPARDFFERFDRSSLNLSTDEMIEQHSGDLRATLTQLDKAGVPPQEVPPGSKRQWVDLYDARLAQLDNDLSRIPRVLAEVGRSENTVVVVTADHGERLFDGGGLIGHSRGLAEAVLHIPLIFNGPGMRKGLAVQALVRSIDIYPTIAAIAGANTPSVIQGSNLLHFFDPDAPDPGRSAFASYQERDHVVRWRYFKLYSHRREDEASFKLFDLRDDPDEQRDIFDANPELARQLQAELDGWLDQESALREVVGEGRERELTPEAIEQLRALGYIGGD